MDEKDYAQRLGLAGRVTEPAIRQAIRALAPAPGSSGLDAGCGIGQHAIWLAEAVGPGGVVTGLDLSPDNLEAARRLTAESSVAGRLTFVPGDLLRLPFADASFDWTWCADTLWPVAVAADPAAGVRELARVVRPGGMVALMYWSSQSLLSGYPDLEARLAPAFVKVVPYLNEVSPRLHFLRALGWMEEAGLERPVARTFVADVQAPLSAYLRDGLAHCLGMLWGSLEPYVSRDDWQLLSSLCAPGSERYILDSSDYYGFVTYTLFQGRVTRRGGGDDGKPIRGQVPGS
jgi:ubiquinone/menaquinone biosynthesis C-methylase UbiE